MREVPRQFVCQAVSKARKQASAAGKHDVAEQDLAELGIACAQRVADELGHDLG